MQSLEAESESVLTLRMFMFAFMFLNEIISNQDCDNPAAEQDYSV